MVSNQVLRHRNCAALTILGLVSLGEGLGVAGSIGSCVSALFRSRVRSVGLVGVWRIAANVWVCSGAVGVVWYELGSL